MTDWELVLELCKRLNLKLANDGVPIRNDEYSIDDDRIDIGSGDGYFGFAVAFDFNPDGSFKGHSVYE
jgi:hypothetical protein